MNAKIRYGIECVVIVALAGVLAKRELASAGPETKVWDTSYKDYVGRSSVTLGAVVRDFQSGSAPGAHPDFGRAADAGAGRYANIFAESLDADGKPVFRSTGQKILAEGTDASGNGIPPARSYIASRPGDTSPRIDSAPGGAVTSAASVSQWFRDVPGVNTSSRAELTFTRGDGGVYTFEGSLDSATGVTDTDYTAEVEYYFVYEAGKNWYFDAYTDAEVWVYIDGKLVIDGGRGSGSVNFDITDGAVVPTETYSAVVTILGTAFSYRNGGTTIQFPVTAAVRVGSDVFDPFKPSNLPITGNLNDGLNPRRAVVASDVPGGTGISVIATGWMPRDFSKINYNSDSAWSLHMTVDSATTPITARVLRDGDPVPEIKPFQNQATITSFLLPYLDPDTGKVTLGPNQAIYLFELYTTNMSAPEADFQDIAVLVDLASSSEEAEQIASGSSGSGTPAEAPALSQRIDLDRLTWLEDGGAHKIKILFANRTGAPSTLRLSTNISTLNLASRPMYYSPD